PMRCSPMSRSRRKLQQQSETACDLRARPKALGRPQPRPSCLNGRVGAFLAVLSSPAPITSLCHAPLPVYHVIRTAAVTARIIRPTVARGVRSLAVRHITQVPGNQYEPAADGEPDRKRPSAKRIMSAFVFEVGVALGEGEQSSSPT